MGDIPCLTRECPLEEINTEITHIHFTERLDRLASAAEMNSLEILIIWTAKSPGPERMEFK